MKTVIIIQARMTSTRLPGKILKTVLGKPLLEYQTERLKRTKLADDIVIATTTNSQDDIIIDFCEKNEIHSFRGSENNVLERYYLAAKKYRADVIVRITSDCPVIDPALTDGVIKFYLANNKIYDYVSNNLERSFPRGMDTEVFSLSALEQSYKNATLQQEFEHVTPYIYTHLDKFSIHTIKSYENLSKYRLTVDTPEDFELLEKIFQSLYPINKNFTMEDILKLFKNHPELPEINSHIEQKKLW